MGWITITKEQIKSVPVGSKIKVCGVTTTLTSHYPEGDCGFNMGCEVNVKGTDFACSVFGSMDWEDNPTIEVWEEHLMKDKFKIGDKVMCVHPQWGDELQVVGKKGVIVTIGTYKQKYGIKFEDFDEGHSLNDHLSPVSTSGFWCSEYQLELVEENLSLEEAIKALEEKHNITILEWEENSNIPETIPLGQIMRVGANGEEELVMLVQVDTFKYNLMCLTTGNRLLKELKISRMDKGGFSTKDIEKVSGWKIIELVENPFEDGQSL